MRGHLKYVHLFYTRDVHILHTLLMPLNYDLQKLISIVV